MEGAWLICPNINKWGKNCHLHRVTSVSYCEERSIMTFRKDRTNADRSENTSNRTMQIRSDQECPTTAFVLTGFGVLLLRVRVCYLQWVEWPIVIRNMVWIPCHLRLTWLNTQPFTCSEIYTEDVGIPESSLPLSWQRRICAWHYKADTYQLAPFWNFLFWTHKHIHTEGYNKWHYLEALDFRGCYTESMGVVLQAFQHILSLRRLSS
jgi:hypothetical protein